MNFADYRRWSWTMVVVAAALVIGVAPTLYAEPTDTGVDTALVTEPAASGELKNVAVIAGAPYEKLISDITFLGTLAGKPETGQMIEGFLTFFTQGKGPGAIDKKQAWGVIVQTDGDTFLPVGCLPVTKPDDLLEVAKGFGAEIKDAENGAKEVVMPNKKSVFVKVDKGMAFISVSAASLGKLPANPQQVLTKMVGEYDLTAHIAVKNVPEMYRQFALQAMQTGVQQGMKKKDDESDEQYAERQKMTDAQMAQMAQMVNEIDSLTFGWAVDSQQQRTYLDFTYLFVPGSKMAEQLATYSEHKTNFAGFYQPDAAATLTAASQASKQLTEADLAQTAATMSSARAQINAEIDKKLDDAEVRDAIKAALADWFDAVEETLESGQMDGGASLHLEPGSLTLVSGIHVKDTAKVESGLKKLELAAQKKKNSEHTGIMWNAAKHAGVTFHTLELPVPEDQDGPRKLLGDKLDIAVGIGPEAVYLAIGQDNLEAVKKAIDASAANKGKTVPPFEFALSLLPIIEVAASQAEDGSQKEIVEQVAEFLRSEAQGRDHIRAVGQMIPNGLKYHFEAEEGVLKAIGKAAAAAQQQKLEAQQQ